MAKGAAKTTTPNYEIDPNDSRFTEVEADKKAALNEVDVTYGNMINSSDKYFQAQMDATQNWADKQSAIQQDKTDFAIEQIEQQKEQAQKDYTKEQSGAYVDWQKQSNQYGVNAEQMAATGMTNTGYSESSQVSMYNTYQNRYAMARESYNRAVLNYDNAIKDARLQNNAALAEIAYNALQKQLELSLEGFQYKNQLLIEQSNKKLEIDNAYWGRYQDVLDQINTENALAEEVRQYNESLAEEQRQFTEGLAFEEEQNRLDREHASAEAKLDREFKEKQARLDRRHDKNMLAAKTKAEKEMLEAEYQKQKKLLADELANKKELLKYEKSLTSGGGTISKGASSSSGSSSKRSGGSTKKTSGSSNISKTVNARSKGVTTTKKTSSSNATIDMNSVLALGYGPISESKLKSLVDSGVVQQYVSGGKIKFKKSAYALKQSMLFK